MYYLLRLEENIYWQSVRHEAAHVLSKKNILPQKIHGYKQWKEQWLPKPGVHADFIFMVFSKRSEICVYHCDYKAEGKFIYWLGLLLAISESQQSINRKDD